MSDRGYPLKKMPPGRTGKWMPVGKRYKFEEAVVCSGECAAKLKYSYETLERTANDQTTR